HHLLAHRDGILDEARALVGLRGLAVSPAGFVALPLLEQKVAQRDEDVGIRLLGAEELFVFGDRAVHVSRLETLLRPSLDLESLLHPGALTPCVRRCWSIGR